MQRKKPAFYPSRVPLYHIPHNARRASLRLSAASARQPVSNSISRQLIIPVSILIHLPPPSQKCKDPMSRGLWFVVVVPLHLGLTRWYSHTGFPILKMHLVTRIGRLLRCCNCKCPRPEAIILPNLSSHQPAAAPGPQLPWRLVEIPPLPPVSPPRVSLQL